MKVSVIMPTFNRLELLKKAIQSFLNQDYFDSDLIILDNGCTDGTTDYLLNIVHEQPRIRVIHRKENKILGSLNLLWHASDADLICQLHDDDQLTEDSLTKRVEMFKNDPFLEVCFGGWHNVAIGGRHLGTYKGQSSNPARILQNEYINFTTMMWKNSLKKKFMFDEELFFQVDAHWKIRCGMETTMSCVEGPVMFYTVHNGQETNRMRRENKLVEENKLLKDKIKFLYGGLFL